MWKMGGRWALWGPGAWAGGFPLDKVPEGVPGNLACKAWKRLAKAGTGELPPCQLGRHLLQTSGGLGKAGVEGPGIQEGEESDSFFFLFSFPPSL